MMKLCDFIKNRSPYIIAEMSANHAGKLENALKLVEAAKAAGADCLKIQTYTADTLTLNCDNEYFRIKGGLWDGYTLYDLYKEAYTPWEWQPAIKEKCQEIGIDFLSTPFDDTAVDFLEDMGVEAYKIASFELVDIPLIEYTASKGKPMIISTGMGSVEEIQEAIDACKRAGNEQIILLKCCSEYPAKYEHMNLSLIPDMRSRFGVPVGLSDHSMGSLAACAAAALGACIIEKHFCLDRSIDNPDAKFSMEPDEFAQMVRDVKSVRAMMGNADYRQTEEESASLVFRRSIFACRDIKKGERITRDNIRIVRPGYGCKPKYLSAILGKQAIEDIECGTPINMELVGKL